MLSKIGSEWVSEWLSGCFLVLACIGHAGYWIQLLNVLLLLLTFVKLSVPLLMAQVHYSCMLHSRKSIQQHRCVMYRYCVVMEHGNISQAWRGCSLSPICLSGRHWCSKHKSVAEGKLFALTAADLIVLFLTVHTNLINVPDVCLQCFDAVGWAAGRASNL